MTAIEATCQATKVVASEWVALPTWIRVRIVSLNSTDQTEIAIGLGDIYRLTIPTELLIYRDGHLVMPGWLEGYREGKYYGHVALVRPEGTTDELAIPIPELVD